MNKITNLLNGLKIAVLGCMLLTGTHIYAETYYVTQSGAGNNSGSSLSNAMSVSQHNSGSFQPGDTIYLNGVITSRITAPSSGSASGGYITYDGYEAGDGPKGAKISMTQSNSTIGFRVDAKSYIIIQDLEIEECGFGLLFREGSHHFHIKRCKIHDMFAKGIYIGILVEKYGGTGIGCNDFVIGGSKTDGNEIFNVGVGTAATDIVVLEGYNGLISYNHCYATPDKAQGLPSDRGIDGIGAGWSHDIIIEHNTIHSHNDSYFEDAYSCGDSCKGKGEDGMDFKACENITIRYNHIYDHKYQAGIFTHIGGGNFDIYGNIFHDNTWAGVYIQGRGSSITDVDIAHNIFYRNKQSAIKVTKHGTDPADTNNIRITNNVIAENAWDVSGLSKELSGVWISNGSGHIVKNNIFYKNRPNETNYLQMEVAYGSESGTTSDNNLFYWPDHASITNWGLKDYPSRLVPGQEAKSIETDPLFVDPDHYDYRLKSGSPATGYGTTVPYDIKLPIDTKSGFFVITPGVLNQKTTLEE